MVYTEIKEKNGRKYYYRVISIRDGKKIKKKRVYLGKDLNKKELIRAEKEADKELIYFSAILTDSEIRSLKLVKKNFMRQPNINFENRYEAFCALFTYNSNAIEGNTLTLQETANLLFEKIVPAKSLREINEVLNHKKAFDFILGYDKDITKEFICELHRLVVKDTLKENLESQIGKYRTIQVYIRGVDFIPPKPIEVPKEMKSLLTWYSKNKKNIHPIVVTAYFHTAFEAIHPFVDGNGRVGRLLMNFILHKNKYPMINIPNSKKLDYYKALHESQIKNDLRSFVKLLLDILKKSEILF